MESNVLRHMPVDRFEDTKSPQIDRIEYKITKRSDIINESAGEVTKTVLLEVDGPLTDTDKTCFCPKIFGMDMDAIGEATNGKSISKKEERFKRDSNTGHIMLPVPIVQPGTYEKSYVQRLISNNAVSAFTEVIKWKAYIARPLYTPDRVKRIYDMEKFLKLHKTKLDILSKEGMIKVIALSNSWRYNPSLMVTKTAMGNAVIKLIDAPLDTVMNITEDDKEIGNAPGYYNVDSDSIVDVEIINEYTGLKVTRSVDMKTTSLPTRIPLVSDYYTEKVIVIDEKLKTKGPSMSGIGEWGKLETWQLGLNVMCGSYAILDILTDINLTREIDYLKNRITQEQARLNEIGITDGLIKKPNGRYETPDKIGYKVASKVKKMRDLINTMSLQLNIMMSLKRQNCEPYELVTDAVPIIPLGYRNRSPITTEQGQVSYRNDKINKFYNSLIEYKDRISSDYALLPKYEDLITYKTLPNPSDRIAIYEKTIRSCGSMMQMKLINDMGSVQEAMSQYLVSSKPLEGDPDFKSLAVRIGSKHGKARSDAQGKRIDRTARGVITPDRTLELDEIGIPYDILKVHFAIELKNMVHDRLPGTRKVSKQEIERIIETMGDKFENKIQVTDIDNKPVSIGSNMNISFATESKISRNEDNLVEDLIITTLREIIKDHRYLAIRFPSLHHLNGLGYKFKIVFSQTIHLNPLVCGGYNADFDGDQMSIYLLSLPESIREVDEILSPIKNDMGTDGFPLMTPTQDMIMGLHLLTMRRKDYDNQPIKASFKSVDEMQDQYEMGYLELDDKVEVLSSSFDNSIFARDYNRYILNKTMNKTNRESIRVELEEGEIKRNVVSNTIFKPDDLLNSQQGIASQITSNSKGSFTLNLNQEAIKTEIVLPVMEQLQVDLKGEKKAVVSTVGRFIFNSLIPQDLGRVNREEDKFSLEWDPDQRSGVVGRDLNNLVTKIFRSYSTEVSCYVRDLFKDNGYNYVTLSGVSLSLEDIKTSSVRDQIVEDTYDKILGLKASFEGQELENKTIQAWKDATEEIKEKSMAELDDLNPVKMMVESGSRGKDVQIAQMIGIRGIMMDANNNEIAVPILENFSEGLSPISYIISSYGSCKGIIDRSNKTAETGDLARHLIFGNSSVIITDGDCGDTTGTLMKHYSKPNGTKYRVNKLKGKFLIEDIHSNDGKAELLMPSNIYLDPTDKELMDKLDNINKLLEANKGDGSSPTFLAHNRISDNIKGRTPVKDIIDKETGMVLFRKNIPIIVTVDNEEYFDILNKQYNESGIYVRSIQTCKSATKGYCARCYGYLFPKHRHARFGDSVGTFAAHALSEPGTQMTMRTFHTGGVADGDTSAGFEQLKRTIFSASYGTLDKEDYNLRARLFAEGELNLARSLTKDLGNLYQSRLKIEDKRGSGKGMIDILKDIEYPTHFTHEHFGVVKFDLWEEMFGEFYRFIRDPMMDNGLDNILSVNFEITARQATSNLVVIDAGESVYIPGQLVKIKDLIRTNVGLLFEGREAALASPTLNGFKSIVPDASDPTKSIIFQDVVKRITEASMLGLTDDLTNPMTALSIGNIMPLGENVKYYADKIAPNKNVKTIYDIIDDYKYRSIYSEKEPGDEIIESANTVVPTLPTPTVMQAPPIAPLEPEETIETKDNYTEPEETIETEVNTEPSESGIIKGF